tara:strand:+ start:558 stop:881 length:324 start_codon:yes stop_codon:yes gene_type:complete
MSSKQPPEDDVGGSSLLTRLIYTILLVLGIISSLSFAGFIIVEGIIITIKSPSFHVPGSLYNMPIPQEGEMNEDRHTPKQDGSQADEFSSTTPDSRIYDGLGGIEEE